MTAADPHHALFRLHRRSHFMTREAQTWLLATAVESEDVEARRLALAVVDALERLGNYTHGVVNGQQKQEGE